MKLISCHITNFGTLSSFDYSFSDGLDVLVKENGWGKTTFAAFIKAMLYGLPRSTKQKLDENERKKYTPWKGGIYGGELVFSVNGKEYRVERTFGDSDTFALYDTATEKRSFDFSENLGDELFGINAPAYERSTFFPQYSVKDEGQTSITAKLNGLIEDESDINAYDHAIALLDTARKRYKLDRGIGGEFYDLRDRVIALQHAKQELENATERLKIESARLENGKVACAEIKRSLEQAEKEYAEAVTEKSNLDRLNHYKHLNEQVLAMQKAYLDEEQFFDTLPTQEEIELVKQVEAEVVRLEGERKGVDPQPLEHDASLFEEIPDEETCNTLRGRAERADVICRTLDRMSVLSDEEYSRSKVEMKSLEQSTKKEPPTYEQIERNRVESEERVHKAKEMHSAFLAEGAPKKKTGKSLVFIILGIVFALAGAGLFFVLPYLVSISGLGLLFLVLGIVFAVKEKKAHLFAIGEYNEEVERLALDVVAAEKKVSDVWESLNVRRRYEDDLRRKEYLVAEMNNYDQFHSLLSELQKCESELSVLSIRRGENFVQAWARFSHARENAIEYRARKEKYDLLEDRIVVERNKVNAFKSKYRTDAEGARNRLAKLSFYKTEWEKAKENKSLFEQEHGVDESYLTKVFVDKTQETSEKCKTFKDRSVRYEEEYRKIERNVEALIEQANKLPDVEAEILSLEERSVEVSQKHKSLADAKVFLQKAKDNLSMRYQDVIRKSFNEYLTMFGGDQIGTFAIDVDQKISLRVDGKAQKPESMSKGWKSILALSTRFAFVDALFPDEKPFLVLDDPFTDLDEENFATARGLLEKASQKYQILYLICHESRK